MGGQPQLPATSPPHNPVLCSLARPLPLSSTNIPWSPHSSDPRTGPKQLRCPIASTRSTTTQRSHTPRTPPYPYLPSRTTLPYTAPLCTTENPSCQYHANYQGKTTKGTIIAPEPMSSCRKQEGGGVPEGQVHQAAQPREWLHQGRHAIRAEGVGAAVRKGQ